MNFSMLHFVTQSSNVSPLCVIRREMNFKLFSFAFGHVSRQFNSFLYGQNEKSRIFIGNSVFKQFLQSSIVIKSNNNYNSGVFISFVNVFKNCRGTDGSAILFNSNGNQTVIKNAFYDCRVTRNGGAIYTTAYEFVCESCCCFWCCQGLASYCYGSTIYSLSNRIVKLNNIMNFQCPSVLESPWHLQIIILGGKSQINSINFSFSGSQYSTGMALDTSNASNVRYVVTHASKSGNSFQVSTKSNDPEILTEYISFLNNTNTKGLIYLCGAVGSIYRCLFYGNSGSIGFSDCAGSSLSIYNSYFDKNPSWGSGISTHVSCTFNFNTLTNLPYHMINEDSCILSMFGPKYALGNTCNYQNFMPHLTLLISLLLWAQ